MGAVATGVGAVVGAFGAIREGKQAQNIANMNAALSLRSAQEARLRARSQAMAATAEAARERRAGRRQLGAKRAEFVSGGVTLAGTATDVLADQAAELELDARLTEFKGDLALQEGEFTARALETKAGIQRAGGKAARTRSRFRAAGGLLTGIASVFKNPFDR